MFHVELFAFVNDGAIEIEIGGQALATIEIDELDDAVEIDLGDTQFANEVVGGLHRAAGGQKIIMNEDNIVGSQSILVNLDGVNAILFLVALLHGASRKLAGLAYEDETGIQFLCKDGRHGVAAAFDAEHLGDAFVLVVICQASREFLKAGGILIDGGDVAEQNARLREVGNGAHMRFDHFYVHVVGGYLGGLFVGVVIFLGGVVWFGWQPSLAADDNKRDSLIARGAPAGY